MHKTYSIGDTVRLVGRNSLNHYGSPEGTLGTIVQHSDCPGNMVRVQLEGRVTYIAIYYRDLQIKRINRGQ